MPAATPSPARDLPALRDRIDAIDRRLLGLLNERATVASEIGEIKKADGTPAFRPEREAAVLDGLKRSNTGPLPNDSVAPIWREIMSACRALETPTRVAYLGPAGTFSELAALGYFGSSIVKLPCANADEVFHATSAGAADFGVVPVENSSEGVVTRSLDLFLTTPLTIVGETSLYVRHNLLRKTDSLDGIAAVCAHPQALAQCHAWLSHHLPNAERRPVSSNAEGARLASLDGTLAGLASDRAGTGQRPRGERVRFVRGRTGDPGRRSQPHALRDRRAPGHASTAQGVGPRLHQPRGLGGQPARRRSRHVAAAEDARRFDDALRVAPRALGAVGVLLLRRSRRPSRSSQRRLGAQGTARGLRVLQGARQLSRRFPLKVLPPRSLCSLSQGGACSRLGRPGAAALH